jgi:hypothetical protein
MGKRSFSVPTWSPSAIADAVALTNNLHMTIGAANNASGCLVQEIEIGGQASASGVMIMLFGRNLVLAATPAISTPVSDGPLTTYGQLTSAGVVVSTQAATPPQRSANLNAARLNLTFNAFGGIVRWQAAPFEEWGILGNVVNVTETSLSNFTGGSTSAIGAHIIYEPFNT